MPHSKVGSKRIPVRSKRAGRNAPAQEESRYTVALAPSLALQVQRYAQTIDTSMSKAIAALVRVGLEGQKDRKQEFFKRLRTNLANDDPAEQDKLIDEFRDLILGR